MTENVHQLLTTLESGAPEDIWEAAKELESLTVETALSLIHLLQNAKNSDTRAAAAYVLGFGRYESARASLEQVLSNAGEDVPVRGHAAEALGCIRNRESVRVLLRNLESEYPEIIYWCVFALGQIGDPEAVPALKRIAATAGDELYKEHSLRAEALNALDEIDRHQKELGPDEKGTA